MLVVEYTSIKDKNDRDADGDFNYIENCLRGAKVVQHL